MSACLLGLVSKWLWLLSLLLLLVGFVLLVVVVYTLAEEGGDCWVLSPEGELTLPGGEECVYTRVVCVCVEEEEEGATWRAVCC